MWVQIFIKKSIIKSQLPIFLYFEFDFEVKKTLKTLKFFLFTLLEVHFMIMLSAHICIFRWCSELKLTYCEN